MARYLYNKKPKIRERRERQSYAENELLRKLLYQRKVVSGLATGYKRPY